MEEKKIITVRIPASDYARLKELTVLWERNVGATVARAVRLAHARVLDDKQRGIDRDVI